MTLAKPLARYASLTGYIELGRSLSVDPVQLMRSVDLDPAGLELQDRWMPAASIARLLELSAAATGRQDFGLRLAERRRLSTLGPLSMGIREEPDARSALRMLIRYQHTYNEALFIEIIERGGLATVVLRVETGEPMPVRQSVELALAVIYQLLQHLLGDRCAPYRCPSSTSAPMMTVPTVASSMRPSPSAVTTPGSSCMRMTWTSRIACPIRCFAAMYDKPSTNSQLRRLPPSSSGYVSSSSCYFRPDDAPSSRSLRVSVWIAALSTGTWPNRDRPSPGSSTPLVPNLPGGWWRADGTPSQRSPRCCRSRHRVAFPVGSVGSSV